MRSKLSRCQLRDAIASRINRGDQEIDILHWTNRFALDIIGQTVRRWRSISAYYWHSFMQGLGKQFDLICVISSAHFDFFSPKRSQLWWLRWRSTKRIQHSRQESDVRFRFYCLWCGDSTLNNSSDIFTGQPYSACRWLFRLCPSWQN